MGRAGTAALTQQHDPLEIPSTVIMAAPCKFDRKCHRPDCYFSHPNGRECEDAGGAAPAGSGAARSAPGAVSPASARPAGAWRGAAQQLRGSALTALAHGMKAAQPWR